jgi:hypothetical protein
VGTGRRPGPALRWAFDLAVSFGALGHFLAAERPALFAGVYHALGPGGVFTFPVGAPQPGTSGWYWALLGFDLAMRARNAVASPVRHVLPHLPAARGPQRPDSIRVHRDDSPPDGCGPARGRQPAVLACPRAKSRHALTAAYAAGLHLIAVSVLPRRTAGQDRPIARPGTAGCAQPGTAIQMPGSSVRGPGSVGWHGRAGRAGRGRSLRDVISSPAFRNSPPASVPGLPSALGKPNGANPAGRNPPDRSGAQPGQGDVEDGGDLVHLGHRSVAFLLLRPLLDDLCVQKPAGELDVETGSAAAFSEWSLSLE